MEILNLGGAQESTPSSPKSRKPLRVLLGIGALAAVTGIGSTLAANITLSGDNNVEFGQGVVTTAACDGTINVAPVSTFVNSDGATPTPSTARFDLGSIVFTGVDITALGDPDASDIVGCNGKTFKIKAYGNTGNALTLVTGVTEVLVSLSSGVFSEVGTIAGVEVTTNTNTPVDGFTIALDNQSSPITADAVYKITVESSD